MKIKFLVLICLFFRISLNAKTWLDNSDQNKLISYIYAPGAFSTEIQMAKYFPQFIGSTGEIVNCFKGIEVIKEPASACHFVDISLKKLNPKFSFQPTDLIKNVSKKLSCFFINYYNNRFGIKIEPTSNCWLDKNRNLKKTFLWQWINLSKINFGQDLDIAKFVDCYENHLKYLEKMNFNRVNNIVLYGVSRGATTIFNYVSIFQPKEVKALICEGIFDSIHNLLQYRFPFTCRAILKLLELFTSFKNDKISPLMSINKMPLQMPILLITSLKDKVVPCQCTINLYKKLRDSNHSNVHILILNEPGHNWYSMHAEDKNLYESVVHAFYKKYNLPYVPELAQKGQEFFDKKTQPDL